MDHGTDIKKLRGESPGKTLKVIMEVLLKHYGFIPKKS